MPDGDYQSCCGCCVYATCANGILYDNRPCPAGLVWDDNLRRCEFTSSTCGTRSGYALVAVAHGKCVSDCTNVPDGDYQDCKRCDGYVTCTNGILFERECAKSGSAEQLVWDDNDKKCEGISTTCHGCNKGCGEPTCTTCDPCRTCCTTKCTTCWEPTTKCGCKTTTPCPPKCSKEMGSCCIMTCQGMCDGCYPSCEGCCKYVQCYDGRMWTYNCPAGKQFDRKLGTCVNHSSTCHELIEAFDGKSNGSEDATDED